MDEASSKKTRGEDKKTLLFWGVVCILLVVGVITTYWWQNLWRHGSTGVSKIAYSQHGHHLAILTYTRFNNLSPNQYQLSVYQLADRELVHHWVLPSSVDLRKKWAWSPDGRFFALSGDISENSIQLWDTTSWTAVQTVTFDLKKIPFGTGDISQIRFDTRGNLYAVHQIPLLDQQIRNNNQIYVWWKTESGWTEQPALAAEPKGRFGLNCSVASLENGDTRLVVSYGPAEYYYPYEGCEIWRIRFDDNGMGSSTLEYEIADAGDSYIDITPDGNRLAVQTSDTLRIYNLSDDHAEILTIVDSPMNYHPGILRGRHEIQFSKDGRFLAFSKENQYPYPGNPRVIRADTGEEILAINSPTFAVALSPDGKTLACENCRWKTIDVYKIPQESD